MKTDRLIIWVVFLYAFNPARLWLFAPDTGYYLTPPSIVFGLTVFLFPLWATVILDAVFRKKAPGFATLPRNLILAALPVLSIGVSLAIILPQSREAKTNIETFDAHFRPHIDAVKMEVVRSRDVPFNAAARPASPYIIFEHHQPDALFPSNPGELQELTRWHATVFGPKVSGALNTSRKLETFPDFICRTAFVYAYGKEASGRQIRLDYESVPEILTYARIYAVNLEDGTRMRLPEKVYGPQAKKPARQPGGGVRYISELTGEKPSMKKIAGYIRSLGFMPDE